MQVANVITADALSGLSPDFFIVTGASNESSTNLNDPETVTSPNVSGGSVVHLRLIELGAGMGRVYALTARGEDLAGKYYRGGCDLRRTARSREMKRLGIDP